MKTPICPACGCSLVRLGIARSDAARSVHDGQEWLSCCRGCAEVFESDPDKYLAEIAGWVVCPACLAEKPKALTVTVQHDREAVHFCRCPCCLEEFRKDPDAMLARLTA